MLRHVVFFNWSSEATEAQKDAARAALAALPGQIGTIRRYEFGDDLGHADGNYDFALVADFDDEAGWRTYLEDPAHVAVVQNHLRPILAGRTAVQYSV